jgi:hypothetical protein
MIAAVRFSPKMRTRSGRISVATMSLVSAIGDDLTQKLVAADDQREMVCLRVKHHEALWMQLCRGLCLHAVGFRQFCEKASNSRFVSCEHKKDDPSLSSFAVRQSRG